MSRRLLPFLGLALVLTACGKPQQPQMPPPAVGFVTITEQPVALTVELPGRTHPFAVSEIRPQINGIVLKRLFREGSDVKAGDQLYQIDPATYEASLASAQADVQKAEANLQAARNKAARYGDLVKNSVVSKQDFDDVQASLKQNEAQLAASKAAYNLASINLNYTKVFAPISGRIGKSAVTEGALVTANQSTALATIQQFDPIYVDVTQTASQLMKLREDMATGRIRPAEPGKIPVTLFLNSNANGDDTAYPAKGELQFSDVTVDSGTSSVQLRAVFPNPNKDLLPGLFVRARVEQGVAENAITVPQAAVARSPDGSARVWVVGADNKVNPRTIKTERPVGNVWLVSDGLAPGERVVVEGLQKVKPGAEVKPVPAQNALAALPEKAASAR